MANLTVLHFKKYTLHSVFEVAFKYYSFVPNENLIASP